LIHKEPPHLQRDGEVLAAGAWLDAVVDDGGELAPRVLSKGALLASNVDGDDDAWFACSLQAVSVAELVTLVVGAELTGMLEVHASGGVRRLYFENGAFFGVESSFEEDRTGSVLWRAGLISLDQKVIATEYQREGKRIGRVLIELGFLNAANLRVALRKQAVDVFEAACLEVKGRAMFLPGRRHKNPVHFGDGTEQLVDDVLDAVAESRDLEDQLAPLDSPCKPVVPPPAQKRDEAQDAMLQLAASAKKNPLTRRALIDKSGLGWLTGLRTLQALLSQGCFHDVVDEVEDDPVDEAQDHERVERLCAAVNTIMDVLSEEGFGAADEVRDFADDPPDEFAEVLSSISLEEPLEADALCDAAAFAEGGETALIKGLDALLDFAMFTARDTLSEDDVEALMLEVSVVVGEL